MIVSKENANINEEKIEASNYFLLKQNVSMYKKVLKIKIKMKIKSDEIASNRA